MVKSWPSCWMTMPGRSCVALTLLICSLERLRISEIQAGQEHGRIRNDSRHAGRKYASNAKQQYKCGRSQRSILPSLSYLSLSAADPFEKKRSETQAFARDRHSRIVNMKKVPSALFLPIELRFPAACREGSAIFSELGSEIP